jgi:hypothetical protein
MIKEKETPLASKLFLHKMNKLNQANKCLSGPQSLSLSLKGVNCCNSEATTHYSFFSGKNNAPNKRLKLQIKMHN